jgi:hypothetical protein
MKLEEVASFFDEYSRNARLYPALLAIAPIFWTIGLLKPDILTENSIHIIVSGVMFFGGQYFFTNIARSKGKKVELNLIDKWGGLPTTLFLRHRDKRIDPYTKIRYHEKLGTLCGITMPSSIDERRDNKSADDKYKSSVKKLIESRRDEKYRLVHKENAQYGFRRNSYGLKYTALFFVVFVVIIVFFAWCGKHPHPITSWAAFSADLSERLNLYICFGLDISYFGFFAFAVNDKFVRQAADEYAVALLRTLDEN